MIDTVEGVYKAIEEQVESYKNRRQSTIFAPKNKYESNQELFEDIGKVKACIDLIRTLRTTLGYHPRNL